MNWDVSFFRNVAINLQATGTASVMIAWIAGVVLLGIFGNDQVGHWALTILFTFGLVLVSSLGSDGHSRVQTKSQPTPAPDEK